jgi:hypothetical protein
LGFGEMLYWRLGEMLQPVPVKQSMSRNMNTEGQSLILRYIEENDGEEGEEEEEEEKKNKGLEIFENKSSMNKYIHGR